MNRGNDTIIYLPMVHVAKPSYFTQVKSVIDSLKKENYTVFYESITLQDNYLTNDLDSATQKELFYKLRKFRKMLGRFQINDLTDDNNKSLPNYYKNSSFISQTNSLIGLDSLDINADVSMTELINAQENIYGEIILSDCDMKTKFNEKYKCKKVNSFYSINSFRDSVAIKKVLSAKKSKSLLIYGKGHWYGIWPYLRKEGFKELE
ncbi:hypothetical protein [Polaribacter sp. OB-PA-B3]